MPRSFTKQQLIDSAQNEYAALMKVVDALSEDEMCAPGAMGEWSAKDVLAHLYEWQQMFKRWYEAGLAGERPAVPAEGFKWSQIPALNDKIYQQYREMPLAQVRAKFLQSHARTLALVESLPEEMLFAPGLYPWMSQNTLASYLNANLASHYLWARKGLRKIRNRDKGA